MVRGGGYRHPYSPLDMALHIYMYVHMLVYVYINMRVCASEV